MNLLKRFVNLVAAFILAVPLATTFVAPLPAMAADCGVNIYPQPTPGVTHYAVTLSNPTSTPAYSFVNNYWFDGQPTGDPRNVTTSPYNYWGMNWGLGYSAGGAAGIPFTNGSFNYELDLSPGNTFQGIDFALRDKYGNTFCGGGHTDYDVTFDDLNIAIPPQPPSSNLPPTTPADCSLNIYPQPVGGTHRYDVTITNNTELTGYWFVNNYFVGGDIGGSPANVETDSDWYIHAPGSNSYIVTGTAGTPIGPHSSITYQTDLTVNGSFNGVDLALMDEAKAGSICSQGHTTYTVTYNAPSGVDPETYLGDMARQADGKVVAVGNINNGSNRDWKIARYNADNSLDTSFGTNGVATKDFGGDDSLEAVVVQPNGKIVVSGYSRPSPSSSFGDWTVARYNADGTLDTAFGTTGVSKSFTGENSRANDLLLQSDGKIVAVGSSWKPSTHDEIALVRYNADGSPDATFGLAGMVTVGPNLGGTPNDRAYAAALQADGKILAYGDYDTGEHRDNVVLARFNANGTLDTSFDGDGFRTDNFSYHNGGRDVAIQSNGKIVVTGATCSGTCDTFVARYNVNGSPDNTFGSNGVTVTSLVSGSDGANALDLQSNGKIVVAGVQQNGTTNDSVVSRFNSNGTLDPSFGANGTSVLAFDSGEDYLSGIMVQPSGQILVGGASSDNGAFTVTKWILARLEGESAQQTLTLTPSADSYVRSGETDRNLGASTFMRVRDSGNNRALVRFDQSAMSSAIGGGTVLSAKLRLNITDNANNWGTSGRTVDLHRLLSDWTEGNGTENSRGTGAGATWACASDSNISNQSKNCSGSTEWEMAQLNNPTVHPWAATPTGTTTITNGQSGVVEYDVTQDVVSFLNGANNNYGWLIKKTNEGQPGNVSFGTKESVFGAELVITYQ